jgi:hypothetical protein
MTENHTDTARVLLEVTAGLIPQRPEPELTRQWAISSREWRAAGEAAASDLEAGRQSELLAERNGRALAYANLLMLQPDRVNWVQTSWIWL